MRGHRQVSRYVACWTGRLCCHSSSVYVIIYLWELINYTTNIMARSSQFAWFDCQVIFFLTLAQSANKRKSVAYVLIEGTGALSCRSKSAMELQHHQWRVHQLVMMEAGRGGIANGIVQHPEAHRGAGVGSPVHKRLAIAAKNQSGQRGTIVNGTIRRAHGKIGGTGAHGTMAGAAKRILARQEVQIMWTAIWWM